MFLLYAVLAAQSQTVVINEYSAANYDAHSDNYGEYEDWIELYNTTNSPVDINGWYLTDKSANPTKWIIPSSFIIPANGFSIIYCSGRDELIGGSAHSNFKITQTKGNEVLMLSDLTGAFQDSVVVMPNQNSHTRGREIDGAISWSVFTTGTPNSTNTGAMQEYEPAPVFSAPLGYQSAPISLSISSSSSIYYTINGDVPNSGSTAYTGPINLSTTTVVKAIAINSNPSIPPSFIEYGTFFFGLDNHTIPVISISGDGIDDLLVSNGSWGGTVAPYSEPNGTIEYFDENGMLVDKGSGEYNRHGNDSWAYDQRGFDYIMRDQFGYNYALKDKIFETKDRAKFQRLIIKAAANDNYPSSFGATGAHIRDSYINHLSQLAKLKLDERSYAPCILYKNGEYWGVYDIREKVDDPDFLDYYYDQDEKYKDSPEYIQYLKYWGGISTEYGGPNAETDWLALKNYIISNPMANNANYQTVKSQFNTGSLIDYFLLNSYVVAADWLNYNTGWWRGLDPNGDKKKWRYELWDMDNTFGHGTNYTGIPNQGPNADPCDPDNLPNPGGPWSQVPIWNALQDNEGFFDDYLNRWQDLANGYFSCDSMLAVLNRMIDVIDPEMDRQIQKWGGNKPQWESNVNDLRNYIAQRCAYMNTGFVPCYPALSGPYNVTVEIIGTGEVEMSDGNFINQNNSGWTDQRFGGINLPFKVTSGNFISWEVVPAGVYVYNQNIDTLMLSLQGDVTVKAYFGQNRSFVYDVIPAGTTTSIDINGVGVNTFPHTENYLLGDTVTIFPNIDPLYGFESWSSDSVVLMPTPINETDSFYATNNDTIKLNLYKKPTIVYDIKPTGTTTTVNINGAIVSIFPYSETVFIDYLNTLTPDIDPDYSSGSWRSNYNTLLNGSSINNSFFGVYDDTLTLTLSEVEAFISGNDTICDNGEEATVKIYFTGTPPFTLSYAIDNITQDPLPPVFQNSCVLKTTTGGKYTLVSFSDSNEPGKISGEAIVTVLNSPIAYFKMLPDTMNTLFPQTNIVDSSYSLANNTNIVDWDWDLGDNSIANEAGNNFYHTYPAASAVYEVRLIVRDNQGCIDTVENLITVTDGHSMYIPNSFSPDLDGKNDNFCLSYSGVREAVFTFNVFDRFSNLVYSTSNIKDLSCEEGWNGKHYKTGKILPTGVYIYEIYYQDFEGWKHQETSEIVIIR